MTQGDISWRRSADSISEPALRSALHAGQQRTPAGCPLPPVPRVRKACLLALSALQRRPAAGPLLRVGPYCARPPLLERSGPLRIRPAPSPALRHRLRGPLGERRPPEGRLPYLPQSHVCLLFFVFLGCVLLTQSLPLLAALLVFQLTAHTVIRAEERWCRQTFGAAYERYCGSVRRYL